MFEIYFLQYFFNLVLQCHLAGILFYDSLTSVSLIFGGKAIHQKNPHQKSLILYIYTFQKLNPKYCLFAFEIGYFGHHASIKWKNFLKFLYKKFKIGGLWCCNKVLHNIVYQMPFTIFWYLNPEFCLTMSPVCLLYIIVHSLLYRYSYCIKKSNCYRYKLKVADNRYSYYLLCYR